LEQLVGESLVVLGVQNSPTTIVAKLMQAVDVSFD